MKILVFLIAALLVTSLGLKAQNVPLTRFKKADSAEVTKELNSQIGQCFLYVEGIVGDSKESNHLNWINIESFEFEINRSFVGNLSSGRSTTSLIVQKQTDISSIEIASGINYNARYPNVILEVTEFINGKQRVLLKYEISNVAFSSYSLVVEKENQKGLLEKIKLNYSACTLTFYSYKNDGTLLKTITRDLSSAGNS